MGSRYGPNSDQAERFLAKLSRLTAKDWEHVRALAPTAISAYGRASWDSIHFTALRTLGQREAERLGKAVDGRIPKTPDSHDRDLATTATMCLALAGELTDVEVAAGYAPFAETIPVADLGPGRAPRIEPPPKTPWQRFITRLRALGNLERHQIVNLAYSLQAAVGVEGIDRAVKATDPADPGAFTSAMEEVKQLVDVEVNRLIGLYEALDKTAGSTSFVEAYATPCRTEGEVLYLCAARALMAVMSQGRMPEREFAILYTPFAGFIPIESLTPAEPRPSEDSRQE
jgi:hypothetical protein